MTSTEYIKSAVHNLINSLSEARDDIEVIELEAAKTHTLGVITKASKIKFELMVIQNHAEVLKQSIDDNLS